MLDRQHSLRLAAMLFVVVAVAPASRADAQQLSLQIRNGLVTLTAENVPLRDILREWGRVSGAVIVNGDKVDSQPVTLRLVEASERAALATLLRNVSGYVLAGRGPGAGGATLIDRIVIVPASVTPRAAASPSPSIPIGTTGRGSGTLLSSTPDVILQAPDSRTGDITQLNDPFATPEATSSAADAVASQSRGVEPPPPPRPASSPIRYLDALDENGNRMRAPTEDPEAVAASPGAATPGPATGKQAPGAPFGATVGSSQPGSISPAQPR